MQLGGRAGRGSRAARGRGPALTLVTLLVALPTVAHADGPFRITEDTQIYDDSDNVTVVSPQVAVHRKLDDDGGEVSARGSVDIISAASVDVVSHASTRFNEVRTEADLSVSKAFGDLLPQLGYRLSVEPDYEANGVNGSLATRLGSSDTTLSFGYGIDFDRVGRTHTPFSVFSKSLVVHTGDVSLTQVIDPETVLRGVYTLTVESGYLAKPYRYVPLFDQAGIDAAKADGVTLGLDTFDRYRLPVRPPENVPDLRIGHAFSLRALRYVRAIHGSLRLDYQLYVDSWGIVAHTVEPVVAVHLSRQTILSLYARLYLQQKGATFWQRTYVVSQPNAIPRYRTLDRELSRYFSITGGARIEWDGDPWAVYAQAGLMYTHWPEFLLLDHRYALIGQVGVRWTP